MAALQQPQQLNQLPLIGPCQHTILNQDLMVPFEGFEDGLTGRSFLNVERPSLGRDGLFISLAERPGVSGDGVAARPAPKRYDRTDRTQIITW